MRVVSMFLCIFFILCLTESLAIARTPEEWTHCTRRCGNIEIPYPFGIEPQCYLSESFAVTCNTSFSPPKPFLTSINMELLGASIQTGEVRVNNPVFSSNCSKTATAPVSVTMSGSPFIYSNNSNRFTAVGCDNYAILHQNGSAIGGCLSMCSNDNSINNGCYGLNCCQTIIPPYINSFEANISDALNRENGQGCKSAFMVDRDWFNPGSLINDVSQMEHVPAVLEWGTYQGSCDISRTSGVILCSFDGYCWNQLSQRHHCICTGCQEDVDGCLDPENYRCRLLCMNGPGGYNCSCPNGYYESYNLCYREGLYSKKSQAKSIIIGCASGLGILLFLICTWLLYKIIKRRKHIQRKQKFFKRNGGLLLQQQLSAGENNIEQTRIFSSKELENATDNYHVNRILGQGGQGTVYKGMLTDGKIVAIKKSKAVDEGRLDEFINEVVILSQVNHRNVVKLLGCCLETEVPLLVYEFVPNGTLFQHLHDPNEEFPISWGMRLRIAIEAASAIFYLHSAASIPIYHRDIKSTNILLDDKYRAKVSDFGTSRSIAVDQTHLTTRVLGTFGYLDPEYFQSSQFTEKSDVYSFGVVLVELLTGQKPISATRTEEGRSLATFFLLSMEENHLFEIIDTRVLKDAPKEEIIAVAKLAKRCLNLNGKNRPTMKTVAIELEGIKASQGVSSTIQEYYEEVDYTVGDINGPWDAPSSTTGSYLNCIVSLPIDRQHLLNT